jgi:hypothetical protein
MIRTPLNILLIIEFTVILLNNRLRLLGGGSPAWRATRMVFISMYNIFRDTIKTSMLLTFCLCSLCSSLEPISPSMQLSLASLSRMRPDKVWLSMRALFPSNAQSTLASRGVRFFYPLHTNLNLVKIKYKCYEDLSLKHHGIATYFTVVEHVSAEEQGIVQANINGLESEYRTPPAELP